MASVSLTDLNGTVVDHDEIDNLKFVNPESYGSVGGVGDTEQGRKEGRTLIVSVNGFCSALVEYD